MGVSKNFSKCFLALSLALISLLCIPTLAQATTYYVAESGNDDYPGTKALPWASVDKAADTMEAGDTVYVMAGSYSGFDVTRSGTADNYISYLAYPGDTPKIGQIYFQYGASYNKFVGFEIIHPSAGGVIMDHNNDYNIVSNCRIHDIGSVGVDISGGSDFNIVEDCVIYDCDVYAIHTSGTTNRGNIFRRNECYRIGDDGFNLSPSTKDTQLIGNVIYDVDQDGNGTADGIHLYDDGSTIVRGNLVYHDGGATGGVFWIHGGSNHIIQNNTFVGLPGFTSAYGGIIWLEFTSNVTLKNNIAYSSDGSVGVVVGINSSTNDDYNDWHNTVSSKCVYFGGEWKSVSEYQKEDGRGLHCISLDPKFVDPASGDFHLQSDSPCKDSGENGAEMGAYGVAVSDKAEKETKVRNRPNPFQAGRGNTYIEYELSQPSNV
ncbi:MAG: right-handed parallel beta-helix repeat-containing protein, partial [Elusimicrobiota bacterium]|nr:right-handed parallel beta-helix repeat-containing protein [Elusimicrobiota bacterium]